MKILLAVDGSPYSKAAAKSVAGRPWPASSELKIISVAEPSRAYIGEPVILSNSYWEEMERSVQKEAGQAIEMAIEQFTDTKGLRVSNEILKGNPQEAILDEAEAWDADLIVLGSHGYTGLKRLLMGSVSYAVMSHAPCSVEIVRSRGASAGGAG